jgi:hypothetical protein
MRTLLIAAPLLLTGCCVTPVYEKPKVPQILPPSLPLLQSNELQCVSDKTYKKLVERELRLREYAEECIVILKEVTVNE